MQRNVIKGELVATQEGIYTTYVFKNLDIKDNASWFKYLMVTKLPNWQTTGTISIGDIGYLEYEIVEAGESYYKASINDSETYRYTNMYFINFIKEMKEDNKKEFEF